MTQGKVDRHRRAEGCDAGAARGARDQHRASWPRRPRPSLRWLAKIGNRNASGEYYLTDVVALAVEEGVAVETTRARSVIETLGVNSQRDLAMIERLYQRAQADALLDAGVNIADPARIDVRGTLYCGRDVRIDVGCIFEGTVTLADDVTIAAHNVLQGRHGRRGHADRCRSRTSRAPKSVRDAASDRTLAFVRRRCSPTKCTSATSSR